MRSESVASIVHNTPSTAGKETDAADDSSIGGTDDEVSEASDTWIESTMEGLLIDRDQARSKCAFQRMAEKKRMSELKRKNPDVPTDRSDVPSTLLFKEKTSPKRTGSSASLRLEVASNELEKFGSVGRFN